MSAGKENTPISWANLTSFVFTNWILCLSVSSSIVSKRSRVAGQASHLSLSVNETQSSFCCYATKLLTEQNSQMVDFVDQNLKRTSVDWFNHVWSGINQIQHPLENLIFVHQVAGVNCAELVTVESQSGKWRQIVFRLDAIVACLNEIDVFFFALVVDVFKFVENLLGFLVAFWICK